MALIVAWATWLGTPLLGQRETQWPVGGEFGFQAQSHYLWIWLKRCGLCALWNGGINGGYPALAEIYGAPLHPVIAVTTLGWGTVVGARLTAVFSFGLAGIAQWWIARSMGLGAPARFWAGLAAVTAGNITGRMELSGISLVLSTASACLALAAIIDLGLTGRRKAAILLAVFGAFALVSGQGYMQVALIGWSPFVLYFIVRGRREISRVWKEFGLALVLALMLAGVFLVPLLHFLPNIFKDGDRYFTAAQPLEYIPLNLVIRDIDFMRSQALGMRGSPHLYNLYVGWTPILLAGFGLLLARSRDWRILAFLASGTAAAILLASAEPFRWLLAVAPWVRMVRFAPLIAGLAVPGVLAWAAYGLDAILGLPFPRLRASLRRRSGKTSIALSPAWLVLIPLAMGLRQSFDLAQTWFSTWDTGILYEVASAWRTPSLEWVQPPPAEHYWTEAALGLGLKLSEIWYPWRWHARPEPEARIEATRQQPPKAAVFLAADEGVATYLRPDRHYASLRVAGETIPCMASGGAGDIRVRCSGEQEGLLIIQENSWDGWRAWVDGTPLPLFPRMRLTVRSSPGTHEYRFRYLPWDAALGFALTVAGWAATIWLYARADQATRRRHALSGSAV